MMEQRRFGRTDLRVPVIGFGCGMVGGLMVGGSAKEQAEAVAHALDLGIGYFDTAPFYGAGKSEANLGQALKQLGRRAIIGTKVRIEPATRDDPAQAARIGSLIRESVEASLARLHTDSLDLLQLHNPISPTRFGSGLTPDVLRDQVVPTFQALVQEGKVRYVGFSALGETTSVNEMLETGWFDTAQVSYSLLDPSSGNAAEAADDNDRLLSRTRRGDAGVIGIRLLAGGSLSGTLERHPTALPKVVAMGQGVGSGHDYARDVACAQEFQFLVREGLARSLVGAALRFGMSNRSIHTLAIGFSSRAQLQEAVDNAADGIFDSVTLERITQVQSRLGLDTGVPSP